MPKGTTSNGKKNKRNHTICKRCSKNSFHKQKQRCASCAYPSPKWRRDISKKTNEKRLLHSKVEGKKAKSGNMTHIKKVVRARRNGFKLNPIVAAALKK